MVGTKHRIYGYMNDGDAVSEMDKRGLVRVGNTSDYKVEANQSLIMAVADPEDKMKLANRIGDPNLFTSLIHPLSWMSSSAQLGRGAVVGPFCDISADALAEDFLTMVGYSSLGHDVRVGSYSTLSGYVDLTGGVVVGSNCFFGSGSRVMPNVVLGRQCRVGAGAVVVRSVGDNVTLYAAPARRM
jgi:acetyltransferase-like isoleucine patch superfamily enzyme